MLRKKLEKNTLKAKSDELEIPFSNLLAGFVLEELLYLIYSSTFSQTLVLKNEAVFGIEQYRNKNLLTLEFTYLLDEDMIENGEFGPGGEISLKLAYLMLSSFLQKEKVPEIKWRGKSSIENNRIEMRINGEFEEMTVPVRIFINPVPKTEITPEQGVLTPFMRENDRIAYLCYPSEYALSENLFLIIKDMELIPDLLPYDRTFEILHSQLVDGRHIQEHILLYCKRDQIEPAPDRMEEILSYREYSYMRKRWNKYRKRHHPNGPNWEDVIDAIQNFLKPVWQACCRDEIFFGDWMPELSRFL